MQSHNILLFVFNDSNYVKGSICWKIGEMVDVQGSNYSGSTMILMSKVCNEYGGITFIEHRIFLITIADAPKRRKLCCTLWSNDLYFRLLTTADLERRVKRRLEEQRSKEVTLSMSLLNPQDGEKVWGEKRIGNKVNMIAQVVGFRHRINTGRDQTCMQKYLSRVSKTGLDMPSMLRSEQFLPVDAPLLDYLVYDVKKPEGWKYPKLKELEGYQSNRGLNLGMLKEIEVKELVCGVSSDEDIAATCEWINVMHATDQSTFASQVVSLDVEDVKTTYYDTLQMAGRLSINPERAVLRTNLEKDIIHGQLKDSWKQVLGKIMFGNILDLFDLLGS